MRRDQLMRNRMLWAGGAWLVLVAVYGWVTSVSVLSETRLNVLLTFVFLGATITWGAFLATRGLWRALMVSTPLGAAVFVVTSLVADGTQHTYDEQFYEDSSDLEYLIIASLVVFTVLLAVGVATQAAWRLGQRSPGERDARRNSGTGGGAGDAQLPPGPLAWAGGCWLLLLAVFGWVEGSSLGEVTAGVTALLLISLMATIAWGAVCTTHRLWRVLIWSTPAGATVLTVSITTSFMGDESGVDSYYPQWMFAASLVEVAAVTAAGAAAAALWRLARTRCGRSPQPSALEEDSPDTRNGVTHP
ncbi:hypothetical protein [Marmoricola sp. URHB0036]|uniref:hypothetical protein n=1 Tax=Marmoricola sp. URHB0036 TaxID=1298863 RepID=UPI0012DE07B6|nr:hypothetical protein [Marmoricola sp. URHB0036]